MWSPRIVLLFLGIVITVCKAALIPPKSLAYVGTGGLLTCTPADSGGECAADDLDGCTFKFLIGDKVMFHGNDNTEKTYTPIRNGDYKCKTSKGDEDSGDNVGAPTPVADLVFNPTLTGPAANVTCGATGEKLTLQCVEGATPGVAPDRSRVMKEGGTEPAWDISTNKKLEFDPWKAKNNGRYRCEMAKHDGSTETLKSVSEWHTVECSLTKPRVVPGDHGSPPTGRVLTCTPDDNDSCDDAPTCTYEWYIKVGTTDTPIDGQAGNEYVVPGNGKYRCKTVKGHQKSAISDEAVVNQLPPKPTITPFVKNKKCGEAIEIICKAGSGTPDTKYLTIQNKTANPTQLVVVEGAGTEIKETAKAYTGSYNCIAATKADGKGYQSISEMELMTCTAPGQDTTSQASGGVDTTSNGSGGNKGDDSGASDLGRPASVLTIVCSLLTLTLALRG